MLKKVTKILGTVLVSLSILFGLYLLLMTVTDYKPKDIVKLEVKNNSSKVIQKNSEISIMTFNIGYGGLDKNQDFFMDGGTGSGSSSKEKTLENIAAITKVLENENTDIIFIQEIDEKALRSNSINELNMLEEKLKEYSSTYAINYKVPWVPVPILQPMGYVKGGMVTFSKYKETSGERYQYPGKEAWPRQLAELDRCFIENRLPTEDGKELVLINSHLSAYDKGGKIRKLQLDFLQKQIITEYEKGNYVIVGGDWNHLIPETDPKMFPTKETWPDWLQKIPEDFKPQGFQWVADKSIPSNRTIASKYEKGENFLSNIDGFLVSPNIEIKSVSGINLNFENSDHNPVRCTLKLK